MSSIQPTNNKRIAVNQDGLFEVKGRVVDMIGLIFEVQSATKSFAQNRLALTAEELWHTNEDSKKLIYLLNKVRGIRPSGGPDSTVEASKIANIGINYSTLHDNVNPFREFDLKELAFLGGTGKGEYGDMKQAQVDQLIEGIKSKLSAVSSKQELLNNDIQKYTRLSDETKEEISTIEKAISNAHVTEEAKI
jgi:hypothetical protein